MKDTNSCYVYIFSLISSGIFYIGSTADIKKRINDTSFDGFNASTTLQNIVDNPIYGENVDAVSEYEADCQKSQEITKDISIRSTAFYFLNPIYTMVSDGWWGSKKQYNLSEKLEDLVKQDTMKYMYGGKKTLFTKTGIKQLDTQEIKQKYQEAFKSIIENDDIKYYLKSAGVNKIALAVHTIDAHITG